MLCCYLCQTTSALEQHSSYSETEQPSGKARGNLLLLDSVGHSSVSIPLLSVGVGVTIERDSRIFNEVDVSWIRVMSFGGGMQPVKEMIDQEPGHVYLVFY